MMTCSICFYCNQYAVNKKTEFHCSWFVCCILGAFFFFQQKHQEALLESLNDLKCWVWNILAHCMCIKHNEFFASFGSIHCSLYGLNASVCPFLKMFHFLQELSDFLSQSSMWCTLYIVLVAKMSYRFFLSKVAWCVRFIQELCWFFFQKLYSEDQILLPMCNQWRVEFGPVVQTIFCVIFWMFAASLNFVNIFSFSFKLLKASSLFPQSWRMMTRRWTLLMNQFPMTW